MWGHILGWRVQVGSILQGGTFKLRFKGPVGFHLAKNTRVPACRYRETVSERSCGRKEVEFLGNEKSSSIGMQGGGVEGLALQLDLICKTITPSCGRVMPGRSNLRRLCQCLWKVMVPHSFSCEILSVLLQCFVGTSHSLRSKSYLLATPVGVYKPILPIQSFFPSALQGNFQKSQVRSHHVLSQKLLVASYVG